MNRNLIVEAFPSQPRMQAAVEALFADAEDATSRLNTALLAIGALGEGAEGIVAQLAAKQPRNDTLDAISILGPDPGVLEQVQAGIFSVRPIDAADVKSLITRELADTRYLGGAHAAASATKLATARSITASGDAAWTVSFDGSANVSAALTLATVNANTGTFGGAATVPQISVDGKGRITGVTAVAISGPSGAALTKTDDTNVTLTLGGTPASALLQAVSVTVGWTGILSATRGGTANGFTAFTGPATATKTFTLPNASATILTDNAAVTVAQGGTGRATSTTAFALLAAGTTATGAHQTLATGATTDILVSGGAAALPVWTTATGTGAPVRAGSPTLTGTALVSALTASSTLKTTSAANAYFQCSGIANSGTGKGLIFSYNTSLNIGTVYSLDWDTGAARLPMRLDATSVEVVVGGSTVCLTDGTGIAPLTGTTASAANVFQSASGGYLLRSTSSARYKRDIETLEPARADVILSLRPVWYRSKAPADNPDWGWYGLIAEEVAKIDPRLVHWGYRDEDYFYRTRTTWLKHAETGERFKQVEKIRHLRKGAKLKPDAVQYDRFSVMLLSIVQRQDERLRALEAKA